MTLENALEGLQRSLSIMKDLGDVRAHCVDGEALGIAVEALKKRIGVKPRKVCWNEWETRVHCPQCKYRFYSVIHGEKVAGNQSLYCPSCGQRIDWSEEE